ncbi:MAG TPA: ComEC/Rec2 family competence protein [Clostridia bacterium]|nr:ComEC/Rec2 family competence protein [Clostridia bacterium]
MKRKLVFAVMCYMAGGALCLAWGMGLWILILYAVAAFVLLYAFLPRQRTYLLTALVFFCIGVSCFALYKADAGTVQGYIGRWAKLKGRVEPVIREDCFLVDVDSLVVDGRDIGYRGKLMLYPSGDIGTITVGDGVVAEGQLKISSNKGYRNYCRGLGAEAMIYSTPYHLKFTGVKPFSIKYRSHLAAGWIKDRLETPMIPPRQGEIMKGLLLGGREVDEETRQRFSAVGISHLLAVSGLHVGIICGVLVWLLKKLGLTGRERFIIICALLAFFSFMVGLTPSVVRASVMMGVLMLAAAVNRKQDMLTSLSVAAFFMTVLKPYVIFSVSFQLSFLACLGIALFYPMFNRVFGFAGKHLSAALSITLASQVLVVPLLLRYFGSFAPVSVLVNILAVPLAGAVLWLTVAYLVLCLMHIPLYYTIAWVNGIIIEAMDYIIDMAGMIPFGNVYVENVAFGFYIAYYLAVAAAWMAIDMTVNGKGGVKDLWT